MTIPASPLRTPLTKRRVTDFIVVHCAATKPSMDIGWKEINQWHVKERGWAAIGYHVVIRRDGTIEAGRPLDTIGAHAVGVNSQSVSVCLVGGFGGKATDAFEVNFTEAQKISLVAVLKELKEKYPKAAVIGHHDVPNSGKTCPNFPVKKWYADLAAE